MWALWMMRNKRRHGEQSMTIWQVTAWACDTTFDLWQIMHPVKTVGGGRDELKWQPPAPDWVKCNSETKPMHLQNATLSFSNSTVSIVLLQ
ncbi:hypothetical protein BAE44_0024979 [Dichanthelium oligosanthes]|uniref:Uncharacterized protein n=1 Tax=Dichanthelium oligosanthes TaxID=888268 RepID=A0A1E5UMA4_9POAL|nr:hypothetical protein BAE44_0024979 [Dichanthelium oligosanthes]